MEGVLKLVREEERGNLVGIRRAEALDLEGVLLAADVERRGSEIEGGARVDLVGARQAVGGLVPAADGAAGVGASNRASEARVTTTPQVALSQLS